MTIVADENDPLETPSPEKQRSPPPSPSYSNPQWTRLPSPRTPFAPGEDPPQHSSMLLTLGALAATFIAIGVIGSSRWRRIGLPSRILALSMGALGLGLGGLTLYLTKRLD